MAEQRGIAVRALGLERLVPRHKLAGRIGVARVVHIAACGLFLDDLCTADRARSAGVLGDGLGVGALRETGARKELAEPAGLDDHVASAFLADNVGHLVLNLDALALEVDLRLLERGFKAVIEVVEQLDIIQLARLDLVQLVLHVGGELVIGNRLELVNQQAGNAFAERCRTERLILLGDVIAVNDGGNRRRVGGRTADAAFLHRTDERCLGVASRRLRKVLGRLDLLGGQLVALIEARQRLSCGILLFLVVRALLVNRSKARERDRMTGCTEHLTLADNVGGNRIENGVCHLAGHKARPDQAVQLELIGRQVLADFFRQQLHVGRTNGFVRVLRVALGLEHTRLARIIFLAVATANESGSGSGGLIRQAERVSTHVGDKTGQTVFTEFNTFVQLLCDAHRAARRHIQLAAGFLLQRRGDERRCGGALFLAALDIADGERLAGNSVDNMHRLLFVFQLSLAVRVAIVAR